MWPAVDAIVEFLPLSASNGLSCSQLAFTHHFPFILISLQREGDSDRVPPDCCRLIVFIDNTEAVLILQPIFPIKNVRQSFKLDNDCLFNQRLNPVQQVGSIKSALHYLPPSYNVVHNFF